MKPNARDQNRSPTIRSTIVRPKKSVRIGRDEWGLKTRALRYIAATIWLLIFVGALWAFFEPDRIENFWVFIGPMISSGLMAMGFFMRRAS